MRKKSLSIENKLISKFFISSNDCWQWIGAKSVEGYGVISINGRSRQARRVMFSLRKREIPKNEFLLSICNNKLCINPSHHCTADETFDLSISKGKKINDCWLWLKGQNGVGYGVFNIKGKPYLVHRLMYEKCKGIIGKDMHVMHSCDNPICCNPSHLILGTPQDNMRDMAKKNRSNKCKGSAHRKATINESTARAIKLEVQKGLSITSISTLFKLPYIIIWQIYNNKSWCHVTI